jgi:hypothetical protein
LDDAARVCTRAARHPEGRAAPLTQTAEAKHPAGRRSAACMAQSGVVREGTHDDLNPVLRINFRYPSETSVI